MISQTQPTKQAPQDVASMARQEYRDFNDMDFDEPQQQQAQPPTPPQRKKSLETTPVAPAQGNFFDTLDWNDGNSLIIHFHTSKTFTSSFCS